MKKIIYIIPGFGEKVSDVPYPYISKILKEKGYIVKKYQPKWKYRTIKNWVRDFHNFLLKENDYKPTVLGFSFGAMIALLEARNFIFNKLILCSLSPFFKQDLKKISLITLKILGKKRMRDFKQNEFPNDLKTPSIFIFGSLEEEKFGFNINNIIKKYSGPKKVFIVSEVGHDISSPKYLEKIKEII